MSDKSGPTKGKIQSYMIEFNPLKQMSEKDQQEIKKIQSEIDKIYLENSVVDPDEIARSRFGSGGFSTETTIDLEARDAMRNK